MKRLVQTLMVSGVLVASGLVSAATDASKELKSYLAGVKSFHAQFAQSVFDGDNQLLQQSSGSLAIARPNKLHWHVTQPDEEFLISDGTALWLYSPFLEQVSVFDLEQAIAQSPFMLLTSDDEAIWSDYQISTTELGYRITPKEVTHVAWLQLDLKEQQIERIVMLDSQGQKSEYQLSNFSSGVMLQEELFNFQLPEGVDLDDQRQAH